jgi:hypothetical protein
VDDVFEIVIVVFTAGIVVVTTAAARAGSARRSEPKIIEACILIECRFFLVKVEVIL